MRPGSAGVSLRRRLIACLDVTDGRVVKGTRFVDLVDAGDPVELAARYAREGADEIVILDIGATRDARPALRTLISRAAAVLDVPLAVGGGVRSYDDAAAFLDAGADKVSINSAALADPTLVTRIAERLGSQSVVVAIDAARNGDGWTVRSVAGTRESGRDAVAWAREAEARGAGEILLTSIDRDGTRSGYDLELTRSVADAVRVPVVASGGAGSADDVVDVLTEGRASAALLASLLHFGIVQLADLKVRLAARGIPVRMASAPPTAGEVAVWLA
jgi:cyclase